MSKIFTVGVPKSKVPVVYPLCNKCGSGTKAIMASPHADGYFRRHRCLNAFCNEAFYTLAPYGDGEVQVSNTPFKNRPLTEFEVERRMKWWDEEKAGLVLKGPTELLRRIHLAHGVPEADRTRQEKFLVATCVAVMRELERMDAQETGEDNV